jgi:hypothetical protein
MIIALCERAQVHFEQRGAEIVGLFVVAVTPVSQPFPSDDRAASCRPSIPPEPSHARAARRCQCPGIAKPHVQRRVEARRRSQVTSDRHVLRRAGADVTPELSSEQREQALVASGEPPLAESDVWLRLAALNRRCDVAGVGLRSRPPIFGDLPEMSNRSLWNVRLRHVWLTTPLRGKRMKRRQRVRIGLEEALVRKAKGKLDEPTPSATES